jgi:hypothetical protein
MMPNRAYDAASISLSRLAGMIRTSIIASNAPTPSPNSGASSSITSPST